MSCVDEITMGEIRTDNKGGREHMVCEECRLRLSSESLAVILTVMISAVKGGKRAEEGG